MNLFYVLQDRASGMVGHGMRRCLTISIEICVILLFCPEMVFFSEDTY